MAIADFFDAKLFMSATITLIVIMDPPGTVPVFLSLVGRKPVATRARAARQADGHLGAYIALAAAIVMTHFVIYICMRYSGVVIRLIKESGITLLAKVAGLLLAAIAVELVANSVRGFISGG